MMFRKISISLLVAVVAMMIFAIAVSAQGRWDGVGPNNGVGMMGLRAQHQQSGDMNGTPPFMNPPFMNPPFMNRSGDGTCVNFVDEDGDGLCDNAGTQQGMGPGGRGMNRGMGSGMGLGADGVPLHQFGDGACDYGTPPRDGTGQQNGQQE